MTERHPPLRALQLEEVAEWRAIERPPEKVGAGCAVAATAIEMYGLIKSSEAEGC